MHFSAPSGNAEAEAAADPVSPGTTGREEEELKGRKSRETKLGMLLAIFRRRRRRIGKIAERGRNRSDRYLFWRLISISMDNGLEGRIEVYIYQMTGIEIYLLYGQMLNRSVSSVHDVRRRLAAARNDKSFVALQVPNDR